MDSFALFTVYIFCCLHVYSQHTIIISEMWTAISSIREMVIRAFVLIMTSICYYILKSCLLDEKHFKNLPFRNYILIKFYLLKKLLLKIYSSEIYMNIQVSKIHAVTFSKIFENVNDLETSYSAENVFFKTLVTLVTSYLKKCFRYPIFIKSRLLHNKKTIKLNLTIYNHTTFDTINFAKLTEYNILLPNCLIYNTNSMLIFYKNIFYFSQKIIEQLNYPCTKFIFYLSEKLFRVLFHSLIFSR